MELFRLALPDYPQCWAESMVDVTCLHAYETSVIGREIGTLLLLLPQFKNGYLNIVEANSLKIELSS